MQRSVVTHRIIEPLDDMTDAEVLVLQDEDFEEEEEEDFEDDDDEDFEDDDDDDDDDFEDDDDL